MTAFTILAALLTALAAAIVLVPLLRWRRAHFEASRVEANASIYREQLAELEAEAQRGAISSEEFTRASREVERRIVAEHSTTDSQKKFSRVNPRVAAVVVALFVPIFAGLMYWRLGNPGAIGGGELEGAHSVTREQMATLVEKLSARMEQTPNDAEGWMLLGRSLAVLGNYEGAAKAYARAVALTPKDAGLLADYADVLAMARGQKLEGEPFEIAKRALEIDPGHVKALALVGTAEFEQGDYKAAAEHWERILKSVPPDSEFGRSVSDSIAEARSRGGLAAAPTPKAPAAQAKSAPAASAGVNGVVSLDPAVAAQASKDDTVFVLARPVSGSRMPLAITRTTVGQLPYRFTLDDSMAMAAGATISSQPQVVVVARVSKSGSAAPQKGDLEGASKPVKPGTSGIAVVISRTVE